MTEEEKRFVALIVGVGLSSVKLLGRGQGEIRAKMFHLGANDPASATSNRVFSLSRVSTGPGLTNVIRDVFQNYDLDPLRLLEAIASEGFTGTVEPPMFPVHLLSTGAHTALPQTNEASLSGVNVADSHLHSGGATDLKELLALVVASEEPLMEVPARSERRTRGRRRELHGFLASGRVNDLFGESFSDRIVLGAVRAHLAKLAGGNWANGKAECASAFRDGEFWRRVRVCAIERGCPDDLIGELLSAWPGSGGVHQVAGLVTSGIRASLESHKTTDRNEMLGLLAGLTLLFSICTSGPAEGLNRFVDRFEEMGIMRDAAAGSNRVGLIKGACRTVFSTSDVSGAEFRKTQTVYSRDAGEMIDRIAKALKVHLLGASSFNLDNGREVKVAMPVGFLKDRREPPGYEGQWCQRFDLVGISELCSAILYVKENSVLAREYITGVDVAGLEGAMPNWPFLCAFDYLRQCWANIEIAFHAGESFERRLQGIRRIAEVADHKARVGRIGHCLALDDDVAAWVAPKKNRLSPDTLSALLDVCWLIRVGIDATRAKEFVMRLVADLHWDEYSIDADSLIKAVNSLYTAAGCTEAEISNSSGEFEFIEEGSNWTFRGLVPWKRAAWLLARKMPNNDHLMRRINADASRIYWGIHDANLNEARDYTVGIIRDRKIMVEACPTSNMRLSGAGAMEATHLQRFADSGLKLTVNSDDPICFNTNVVQELQLVAEAFGEALARQMASESVRSCSAVAVPTGIENQINADYLLGS